MSSCLATCQTYLDHVVILDVGALYLIHNYVSLHGNVGK